jgi:anti-sigma regulatory factor (Ser/Thr protein kinase)
MEERWFPRQVASLPAIVGFVAEFGTAHGLHDDLRFDVELVLEELFTNLVKYADGATSDIAIGLAKDPHGLTIRLRDPDPSGFDPTAPQPERPADALGPVAGGRGLKLVRTIADELRYERHDGFATLTVTKRIPD